ncbi:uncharacterized protein LOC144636073 [Oculina patagonica]
MALLFIITVLSLTGTLVDSASTITGCDAPTSNVTCVQGSCAQPPCTMQCGLSTPYEQCEQLCSSSCDSVKCDASSLCRQTCEGNCMSLTCDAQDCFQICDRGICGEMTCAKNDKSATSCEQSSPTAQMSCEKETCTQSCTNGGNCTMTCSSDVKLCIQSCLDGNCQYKCEAEKCTLNCKGGTCTIIESPTNSGDRLQMTASLGLSLIFAVVAFM